MQNALLSRQDPELQKLIQRTGFAIEEVRMSPDNLVAYILWNCLPGEETDAERILERRVGLMRTMLAQVMKVRRVPRLEFRLNEPTEEQQEIDRIFKRLESEF